MESLSCKILDPQTGQNWPATIQEISASRLGMVLDSQIPLGYKVLAEIHNHKLGFNQFLGLTIDQRHPEKTNHGWLYGCSLAHSLTEDEVLGLRNGHVGK